MLWALPRLRYRWRGFRRVRRQVCRRIWARCEQLGITELRAYRDRLERREDEWLVLRELCRVTISRFYRDAAWVRWLDREGWNGLSDLAEGGPIRVWSAGCASGEEPFTLVISHWISARQEQLAVVATDVDEEVLRRARRGSYGETSLRELPSEWKERAFVRHGDLYHLREELRDRVLFLRQDLLESFPCDLFHLVLWRNLPFTYFDEGLQRNLLGRLEASLLPGGYLIIGAHERLPDPVAAYVPVEGERLLHRRRPSDC